MRCATCGADSIANKSREAYTGNIVGRRGDVPPQSNSAPLVEKKQLATVLTCRKPVNRDRNGEILRDCRGPRAGHIVREAPGTRSLRLFGRPLFFLRSKDWW